MQTWWKPCLAELIGTFALVFIGAGAICTDSLTNGGVGLLGIAVAHGLVLAIIVSGTGHLSGGHINPAVTLGLLSAGKIKPDMAIRYIISQLVGASLAGLVLRIIYRPEVWQPVNLGTPGLGEGVGMGTGILVEAILTFFLVFTVFATAVDDRGVWKAIGGFGIGLVLTFDILMGGPLTGASMNPARTFGPALFAGYWDGHLVYWIGPILGGWLAALVYKGAFLKA